MATNSDDTTFGTMGIPAENREFRHPAAACGCNYCGDLDIRIDRNGEWYYQGSPIGRKELVCLFASVLTRDDEGIYWLVTPTEMGRIEVDDVPFLAVEMFICNDGPQQALSFRTNVDEIVTVDQDHPIRIVTHPDTGEPTPYVGIRPRMEARIVRSVYYELVSRGKEEKVNGESHFGVWSNGSFFPLGKLDEDG